MYRRGNHKLFLKVVQVSTPVSYPQILNMDSSNTCLGGHPILAGLQQKLAAYEKRTNDLEEQLVDLAAKFVWLESENQSMHTWYTSRIISVWEGLQHLGEWTMRSIGSMVQVVRDDNAKHKRLAELMEETHLCLGIPYTPHQGPLRPAATLLPSADIQPPAKSSNLPPPQELPTSATPAEPVVSVADEWDSDLPLPPPATPHTPRTSTTHVQGNGGLTSLPPSLPHCAMSLSMAITPQGLVVNPNAHCQLSWRMRMMGTGRRSRDYKSHLCFLLDVHGCQPFFPPLYRGGLITFLEKFLALLSSPPCMGGGCQ